MKVLKQKNTLETKFINNADTYLEPRQISTFRRTFFFYKHTAQFEPEIMLDGMLNFKINFMVWYYVWYEPCNGLF